MKTLQDFFSALAAFVGLSADENSVSEVHQAVMDKIEKQTQSAPQAAADLQDLTDKFDAMQTAFEKLTAQQSQLEAQIADLQSRYSAVVAENTELKNLAAGVPTNGATGNAGTKKSDPEVAALAAGFRRIGR